MGDTAGEIKKGFMQKTTPELEVQEETLRSRRSGDKEVHSRHGGAPKAKAKREEMERRF